jgi:transcriptional regulator with XRE-family HTH domain
MRITNQRSALGRNIAYHRKKRRMTQADLARISGVSRRMIAYYETKPAKPPVDVIMALAKALNLKLEDLIGTVENQSIEYELLELNIDGRTLNKIKQLLSLPKQQRHKVYEYLDLLSAKNSSKKAS